MAARSRLRLPEGFTARPHRQIAQRDRLRRSAFRADALHGDWANLALEADGMLLGRARLQLFRPASIRLMEAMQIHFGAQTELTPDPPIAPIEPKAGSNWTFSIRNNDPEIQHLPPGGLGRGPGFLPAQNGNQHRRHRGAPRVAADLRGEAPVRACATGGCASPAAPTSDLPMRVLLLPRGRTVAWTADLDGDGSPEWVLESQKVRAVFSSQDGGRWMELNAKDLNVNFLPEQGVSHRRRGPVEVHAAGDALEFAGKGWKRTVRLADNTLTIEQTTPLPADGLTPDRRGNVSLTIARPSATRAVYTLQ